MHNTPQTLSVLYLVLHGSAWQLTCTLQCLKCSQPLTTLIQLKRGTDGQIARLREVQNSLPEGHCSCGKVAACKDRLQEVAFILLDQHWDVAQSTTDT